MRFKVLLATERQRRRAAEAEVVRLQVLLATATASITTQATPATAQNYAQAVEAFQQSEQLLANEQALVRQIIDTSPNLVYVEDEAGRCILANKRYAQLLSQRESAERLPHTASSQTAEAAPAGPLPDTAVAFQETYRLKDGQTLVYHTTKSPLTWGDGTRYVLTFSSDVTALKRAHQLTEELVQHKQLLMANMSHEIRTPLHGIAGLAELLKKGILSAEQTDYLEMIRYNTDNLLMVVDDILEFTKIEAGQLHLENIPFDLLKAVRHAAHSFTFEMAEKGLLLHIVGPKVSLPLAKGDPYRLHQILTNLISNAVKFTSHGSITITIDAGEWSASSLPVTISVADTGIGIGAASLDQVFNSFGQADSSIPRLYGGTGLGLTICKNLVELQGGRIGLHSELGRGSCFYFTIAYGVSHKPLAEDIAAVEPASLLQGLDVLLVEDNAVNQLIAVSMLSQWQVAIDMAQNGEDALAKAFQRKYDLILMDIQMPQLDGFAATSRLRQEPNPNQHTPIVAMTADALRVNADSCQKLGFTTALIKPYNELALYKLLVAISQNEPVSLAPPPGPVAPATSELHYDFLKLGKLAFDTVFIRKMMELFIDRVPSQVQLLKEAIECQNWPVSSREAHTLKTTFGSLNIQPTADKLKRLEELIESQTACSEAHSLVSAISQDAKHFTTLFSQRLV